ncbi:MAG TPA: indole-3-glycerol phosphate synthase TrpC [Blastocatellia bacterium]|nr:indole-3-glycerol phosphate synthase TrpC [Blastocatellia bacterium]
MSINTETSIEGLIRAGGILDRIVDARIKRLEEAKSRTPIERLKSQLDQYSPVSRSVEFIQALRREDRTNIIAEIKRRSPSKGTIREPLDPASIASSYRKAGAAALSVLTEEDFFGGSVDDLIAARRASGLPALRKDFLFDPYQVYEAAAAGAAAILLITAILDDDRLLELLSLAREAGLAALVEVHTEKEMERSAQAGAEIIGINNRDLTSFNVDLRTSLELGRLAPSGVTLVSESGIKTSDDLAMLRDCGFHAFLIGERFMTAEDPGGALKELIGA